MNFFFFHRVKMRSIRNSWFLLKNKQVVIRRQEKSKKIRSKFQDVESFHKILKRPMLYVFELFGESRNIDTFEFDYFNFDHRRK